MSQYERLCKVPVPIVLSAMERGLETLEVAHGIFVGVSSIRMLTYLKGVHCVHCNKPGHFFAVERDRHSQSINKWHLNLYHLTAVNQDEVMMTSDHILAKVRGGSNTSLDNRQPMCQPCNSLKGKYATVEEGRTAKKQEMLEAKVRKLVKMKEALALCLKKAESGDNSVELAVYIGKHLSTIRNLETSLGVNHGKREVSPTLALPSTGIDATEKVGTITSPSGSLG